MSQDIFGRLAGGEVIVIDGVQAPNGGLAGLQFACNQADIARQAMLSENYTA